MGCEQHGNLRTRHARDGNALGAAFLPGHDSNSRYRYLQTLGQQPSQSLVCAVIHGWSSQTDFQRTLMLAFDRIATRPRRNPHSKRNPAILFLNLNHEVPSFAPGT